MDSSFTRPLVCSFYFLLSSMTLYLSFKYYHSKSHQILNKTLIFYPFLTTTELFRPPIFLIQRGGLFLLRNYFPINFGVFLL